MTPGPSDTPVAATSRPTRLLRRADLVCRRQVYQDRVYWVVKDPVGLQYFRLEEEEFFLLEQLRTVASLEDLQAAFQESFAPQKIGLEELARFLGHLHSLGLVYSQSSGQGQELMLRNRARARRELLGRFLNPFAIRFRGFNPQRFLDRLYPWVRWMYSPWAVTLCLLVNAAALTLLVVRFDEFHARLPAFHQFFNFQTGLMLMGVLGIVKILHELGHGLTCRRHDGECPELGIMLLVFTPCLYCNVSDVWMVPSKRRRAAVGAAGIYVELHLAALATLLWWFTAPGLVHHLALGTMFVCSISTLMFNGNPLLRYDGYYVLSDLLEVPNLAQKASSVLRRVLGSLLLGLEPPADPFLPRRHHFWFGLYAVAAPAYRLFVVLSILWFVREFLKPHRLENVANVLAAASLGGLLAQPLRSAWQFLRTPGRSREIKTGRAAWSSAVLLLATVGFFCVPLPHRVYGTLELKLQNPLDVFVEVPGELVELTVRPGAPVAAGTKLAQLRNLDLDLTIARLVAERDRLRVELENARYRRFDDPLEAGRVPELEESLAAYEEQLTEKLTDHEHLTLTAGRAGTVLPPPAQPKQPADDELETWHGTPYEPRNIGCLLTEGTLLCHLGTPDLYEAVVVVDQADIPWVRVGQAVEIKIDQLPHDALAGSVAEVSRGDLKISSPRLSNKTGGELSTKTDAAGRERPQSISYEARVPLAAATTDLRPGLRGRARIHVESTPLSTRTWRWFCDTFHFRI